MPGVPGAATTGSDPAGPTPVAPPVGPGSTRADATTAQDPSEGPKAFLADLTFGITAVHRTVTTP